MHTQTNHAPDLHSGSALSGILALLVAEREEREGRASRRTERILARTGLSDDQIAAVTGDDEDQVRRTIENDTKMSRPAGEQSVIDRARAALTAASTTNER